MIIHIEGKHPLREIKCRWHELILKDGYDVAQGHRNKDLPLGQNSPVLTVYWPVGTGWLISFYVKGY